MQKSQRRSGMYSWLSRFQIGQKIGLGYGFVLGIAVTGTATGFVLADHLQQQAHQLEAQALERLSLLTKLETTALQVQKHQHMLAYVPLDATAIREHSNHLIAGTEVFQRSWQQYRTLGAGTLEVNDAVSSRRIQATDRFFQMYWTVPEAYLEELLRAIHPLRLLTIEPEQIQTARRNLVTLSSTKSVEQFEQCTDDLAMLSELAQEEYQQSQQRLLAADRLRWEIVISSMVLSSGIASLLAWLTTRAIAAPVQTLTAAAQRTAVVALARSLHEAEEDLHAPVSSQDEIGILATSFNHLIDTLKDLLQQQQCTNAQLEAYSQTLEQKVNDRTQELSEKNRELKRLLDELNQTQTQMVQSEKMSSLGQLVAGVAHEINNPINFIYANLEHLNHSIQDLFSLVLAYQQHYPHPPALLQAQVDAIELDFLSTDLPKLLQSMQMGTDRIREIVLSLRNFSRLDEAELKPVDIHQGIDSTLLILRHRLKGNPPHPEIQVTRDYGQLPAIECYSGQLNQVLMNLLTNAIDAIEARWDTEPVISPGLIQIQTRRLEQNWVAITITDNGSGIADLATTRLFDPFFTTKAIGKGTGLGLSISHQIVTERHHGSLKYQSAPGQGTLFIVEIPIHQ